MIHALYSLVEFWSDGNKRNFKIIHLLRYKILKYKVMEYEKIDLMVF